MSKERGPFISFEGGEGAGKSTQIKLLDTALKASGYATVATREPGGSATGEALRKIALNPPAPLSPMAEALIMFAARRDHLDAVINPARADGSVVLTDRFADSTEAYQCTAGGLAPTAFRKLYELSVAEDEKPNLTIILDIDPQQGLERAAARSAADGFEARGLDFHRAVRDGFLAIAEREPERCVVIDAARSAEAIAADIAAVVRDRLRLAL